MATTTVLFEDVEPFKTLNFPITFQAVIDHRGRPAPEHVLLWTVDRYEAQGANGGWVYIPRGHPLWDVFDDYATSDAGYERIEAAIAAEIEAEVPDGIGAFKHHREYEVAL